MIETKIKEALENYFKSVSDEKFIRDLKEAGFLFSEHAYSCFKGKYSKRNRFRFSMEDGLYLIYIGDAA